MFDTPSRLLHFSFVCILLSSYSSFAQKAATPAPSAAPNSAQNLPKSAEADKVDFNAKDVWNVDIYNQEDHKVLVIHDRKFTKSKKFEIGLDSGTIYSDPFYNSWSNGGHLGYHLSEYWSIQAFGNYSKTWYTPEAKRINDFFVKKDFKSSAEYHRPLVYTGVDAEWAPMYGKFALFRSNIIYFDLFGSLGVSASQHQIHFEMKDGYSSSIQGKKEWNFGSELSLGSRFYISPSLSFKAEAKNMIYKPKFYELSFASDSAVDYTVTSSKRVWRNQTQILFSLTYLIGRGE